MDTNLETIRQLLIRSQDDRLSADEKAQIAEALRNDPEARRFLRDLAEQAVTVAEIERTKLGQREELLAGHFPSGKGDESERGAGIVRVDFVTWRRVVAAAALICLLALLGAMVFPRDETGIVRVVKVTGSAQYFGSNEGTENALSDGALLKVGDTIETRSCDAWIELEFGDGSKMTIAGHSALRIFSEEPDGKHFKLLHGNLWMTPGVEAAGESMFIHTPTVTVEAAHSSQLDVQTSLSDTILRVNEGKARFTQLINNKKVEVLAGRQVIASLRRQEAFPVVPQPRPVNYWTCELAQIPDVTLGKWLPPTGGERARLGAEPLLWPLPGREPVMLYAVALSVWSSSERPVLLESDAMIRIRGRTASRHAVRFGFSTQRMQGVFAGKFEMDVKPEELGPVGETWEIELPLSRFKPLHPQLPSFPDGLELTDIFALTVVDDAGLEINHIELIPRAGGGD